MSPGIRSGVNWTRLVPTDRAAASERTSRVLATPGTPSISTCPPDSSATSSPDTAASCPTTALATSVRTRLSASRAASGATVSWCHGRCTSFSRAASSAASRVNAVSSGTGRETQQVVQGGDVAAGGVRHLHDQDAGVGGRRQPEPRGEPTPGRRTQDVGGVLAVADLAVEPAAALGRLHGLDHDRQRLHDQRSQPTAAPQHQRQHRGRSEPQGGDQPARQLGRQRPAVTGADVAGVGDVPHQPARAARAAAAPPRRCPPARRGRS